MSPPDPEWTLVEHGFDVERAAYRETVFTVGNGRLGTRGSLEEGHLGALSGTYLAGVYDAHDSPVTDLVNVPDRRQAGRRRHLPRPAALRGPGE